MVKVTTTELLYFYQFNSKCFEYVIALALSLYLFLFRFLSISKVFRSWFYLYVRDMPTRQPASQSSTKACEHGNDELSKLFLVNSNFCSIHHEKKILFQHEWNSRRKKRPNGFYQVDFWIVLIHFCIYNCTALSNRCDDGCHLLFRFDELHLMQFKSIYASAAQI